MLSNPKKGDKPKHEPKPRREPPTAAQLNRWRQLLGLTVAEFRSVVGTEGTREERLVRLQTWLHDRPGA